MKWCIYSFCNVILWTDKIYFGSRTFVCKHIPGTVHQLCPLTSTLRKPIFFAFVIVTMKFNIGVSIHSCALISPRFAAFYFLFLPFLPVPMVDGHILYIYMITIHPALLDPGRYCTSEISTKNWTFVGSSIR